MAERRVLPVDLDEFGGNVGRLLALAGHAWTAHGIAPMILSSRPGIHFAIRAGHHCEYFPCYTTNGFDHALWNRWLERRILLLCEAYGFDWIVYVGDRPPIGLLSALDGLAGTQTVWVGSEADPGNGAGPPDREVLIQFDRRFEESRLPQLAGARARRRGRLPSLPPIFRRLPGGTRSPRAGQPALFLAGMNNTRFAQGCRKRASELEALSPELILRRQVVDLAGFSTLAAAGDCDRNAPTPETIAGRPFVMFEQADAAILCEALAAGVPAILLEGDSPGRDRLADFLKLEGLGVVLDAAAAITPRKARALPERLARARRRLAGADIASGAQALWTALLCKDERTGPDGE